MSDAAIYFVARTDVDSSSGLQRSFGAFDDATKAWAFVAQLQSHMQGTFDVFEGVRVSKPQQET